MAYNGDDNNKFAPEDFASIEAIDEWWPNYSYKYIENNYQRVTDADGYTPLGAAVLNSAPLECIAHIMELYTFDKPKTTINTAANPFIDVANDISKGRSPIGVACLAMNADAVDVLRSQYYEYILKDEDGNPIPKLDHYGDPINAEKYVMYTSVPLLDEYTKEEYKYSRNLRLIDPNTVSDSFIYKKCEDTETDWLASAALPKADILIKLIPKISEGSAKPNYNDITDDNGNTLILLACVAGCHESVVHIRNNCSNFNDISTMGLTDPDQIFIKNSDDLTAFDVALESQDTDLLPLLLGDQDITDFIDKLLIAYFHEKADKKINKVLIKLITAENIYDYYVKEDIDGQPNKYNYGYPDDPDTIQYYIIEYIEKENNTSLFNLLLPKYNDPEDGYEEHLDTFFNNMCSHIIAFLYRKSFIPFNKDTPTENLNELLDFHNNELYADIVEILFKGGYITLKQICDIDSTRENKRNNCVDKIFTGEYNKKLFIQLLLVDSDNRDDTLVHLYNDKHYFTLQNIAELHNDPDLNKDDDFLFDIIYALVKDNEDCIAAIDSDIISNISTYYTFKVNCCTYLYKNGKITINNIVDSECDAIFKCNIINALYYNAIHNIENGKLKLEDIYYIYNNYDTAWSNLLDQDLRPLIGYMKYCENDSITSDFFWAYNFSSHSSARWRNPQKSYVDIPPITDNRLMSVNDSSNRYKKAKITGATTPINPDAFRFGVYNYKPEFEIDSAYNATNDQNAMIVAFGSDINNINTNIINNIPVQSDNNELYSIGSGTYLGASVNVINWITSNSLYAALSNQLCYSKESSELPVINSIQFKNDYYSGLAVSLPADGNKITAINGTHWNLPSVSGGTYTDTEGIKYEAAGWKIGSTNYNFGDEYVFNDNDVVAQLEFAKAAVILTYQKSNYATLEFNLPTAAQAQSGDTIQLATFDSQYYYTTSGIKYEAKNWIINGTPYNAGNSYRIFDNTIAELRCDRASVTLTYTKPASVTLYNESGNAVSWPSTATRDSGTNITLATLSNTYYNADRTKTYTLTGWRIGSTNYNFGDTYTLKDNTTASLQYVEATITVGIVCSVSSETIIEGAHFTRTFKLSHKPIANVTLNISSNISSRLYIGNSQSSTTNSISLTFTTSNWNNEQTVYFRAIDDSNVNGDAPGTVSIQANSTGDNRYNGLTRSFSITVRDNDSAVVEHIGKFAFASNIFNVEFVNNNDKLLFTPSYREDRNSDGKAEKYYNPPEYAYVINTWSNVYNNGFYVEQVPKSPYYNDSNVDKHFEYDLLYSDNAIIDDDIDD